MASYQEVVEGWAICPPTKEELTEFPLRKSMAMGPDLAWEKFCAPSLRRDGFERDGFKAIPIRITIEVTGGD